MPCEEAFMAHPDVMVYLAVFGGIALFTVLLTAFALRVRRAGDAASLALRAKQVLSQCRGLLVGPDFFWTVWQDTAKAAAMTILVRDSSDAVVATITVPAVPLDGVLKTFELDGNRYEICKPALMSNRTYLREAGRTAVLLSADHEMLETTFFRGDGGQEMLALPMTTVLSRFRPCRVGGQEIGKLIVGVKQDSYARVITLPEGRCSRLEQVFVLADA